MPLSAPSSDPDPASHPSPSNSRSSPNSGTGTGSSSSSAAPADPASASNDDDGGPIKPKPKETPSSHVFSNIYSLPSFSGSSSSSSSSSPLYPFPGGAPAPSLASKHHPALTYFTQEAEADSDASAASARPAIPEKCFSFCTQSNEGMPMCRMLCWRKRPVVAARTQEDDLKRLRPAFVRRDHSSSPSSSASASASASTSSASASGATNNGNETWGQVFSRPFDSLRSIVTPYSIIYVKGTPDGIVGRYMEELEYDDGEDDFGRVSRGQVAAAVVAERDGWKGVRRKKREEMEEDGMEWMDWGDQGSLLYLPLTSLLHPLLSIPQSISTVLSPTYSFLSLYSTSFTDGTQRRSLNRLSEEISRGGAWEMLGKLRQHWAKRLAEGREKREEMLKQRDREAGVEVEVDRRAGGAETAGGKGVDVEGKGE